MPADIFMTYTRPSTDVAWPPKNEARRQYIIDNYINTGKLLVNETIEAPDGLHMVVQRQFDSEASWNEFKNDQNLKQFKDASHAYMLENNITFELEFSYY